MNLNAALVKSAIIRATRTAVVAFVAPILMFWLKSSSVDGNRITGLWDAFTSQWDFAAGAALIAAIGSFGWRLLLDPSPLPSLVDDAPPATIDNT